FIVIVILLQFSFLIITEEVVHSIALVIDICIISMLKLIIRDKPKNQCFSLWYFQLILPFRKGIGVNIYHGHILHTQGIANLGFCLSTIVSGCIDLQY